MQTYDERMEELILYLAEKSQSDEHFGKTKLNKLLFFCDFLAFRAWQRSITGDAYVKREFGPCPKGIIAALEALMGRGDCAPQVRERYGLRQDRIVALRPPNLGAFSAQEIGLIDEVLQALGDQNATQVSDLSHTFIGWKVADMGEEIPYEMLWVEGPRPLTPAETEACRLASG